MLLNLLLSQNISILTIIIFVVGFIFSIGFHEFSHAKSAQLLGDLTPVYQGRVTLNPLAHLDPIGTVMMFFAFFGWGKPVEVNPQNMGMYPERKYFISSIVGPISNIFLATVIFFITWGLVWVTKNFNVSINSETFIAVFVALQLLFSVNIVLAIFNLIPIPPLDGSKIWGVILPYNARIRVEPFLEQYSLILMVALALPIIPTSNGSVSIAGLVTTPIVGFVTQNVFGIIK